MDRVDPLHPLNVSIAEQVHKDRLQQLFRQSYSAVLGSFLAALMLCWLCWDRLDRSTMLTWLALLTSSTLLRTAMFLGYFRSHERERTPRRWERTYWVSLVLSAGIWGLGALALIPSGDLAFQALVMLFTVGMSVAAVSCYSAYRYMTLVSMALVLLPCAVWLLLQGAPMPMGIGFATLVFASFVAGAARKLSKALEKAFRLTREMEQAHQRSHYAAQTDELTGLNNRRAFFELAEPLYEHCRRNRLPLCAVMLDMDHFKHINDTYGHQVGDQVLRQMGRVITSACRNADVCGRLGGEEFAMLLPDTSIDAAQALAERLVQTIANLETETVHRVTASLGVATLTADGDLHSLLNRADKAQYRAKALGRNQAVVAHR